MDTMNIPHVDNSVGTPPCPTSQCSRPDEESKRPYLSTTSTANAVPSSSSDVGTTRSPSGVASPPPSCAICLGAFVSKCMPDICMHQFCFNCLLQWSKVKAVCPLCKQPFLSIIHNVRSNYEYDEHVVERPPDPEYYLPNAPQPRHFQFRTTFTVDPRGELAIQQMLSSHPLTFPIGLGVYDPYTARLHRHAERAGRVTRSDRRNYVSSTAYRRSIYEQGLWAVANPDGADMHREATPDFYRNNEGAITRLVPWLNRELSVLMQHATTEHIASLIDQMLVALPRHHILSRYMLRDLLQPHLHQNAEQFAHEFYNYMRSPLDMIGYDRSCIHAPRVIENIVLDDQSTDDSDNSTVLLLDQTQSTSSLASTNDGIPFIPFMPTPFPAHTNTNTNDIIEIPDSDGADSDVILQTPPPPTIVDLLDDSSDGDVTSCAVPLKPVSKHDVAVDASSVQELDGADEAGPSTSRPPRKMRIYNNRCTRHDEYVVDRKTVLPLKIRLKRKRHQPSKRSSSKTRQCCRNVGVGDDDGNSSSSSNDVSLQSRLKRRRKFHKKKYYMCKEAASSSDSSSSSSSGSRKDVKPQQQQQPMNNLFSSSDDDEPLSYIRRVVCNPVRDGGEGGSRSPSKVRTKREGRESRAHHGQGRIGGGAATRSNVVPPGVFEPSVLCRSPFFTSTTPTSSPSTNSQSSRYTPEPPHHRNYNHTPMAGHLGGQRTHLGYPAANPTHDHPAQSHTPPLPTRPYSPFMLRRHDYYRSLVHPTWPPLSGPSTSTGGAASSSSATAREMADASPFAVDTVYSAQRQHDAMFDPMWNGIRPDLTREGDTAALSMRTGDGNL